MFDCFIHLDATDPMLVYTWRQEAETKMIAAKGTGMTEEQVKRFVDGCRCWVNIPSLLLNQILTTIAYRLPLIRALHRDAASGGTQGEARASASTDSGAKSYRSGRREDMTNMIKMDRWQVSTT